MKLDFNETNILIHVINDLEKYKKPINKSSIVSFLHELKQNTAEEHIFIRKSTTLLASKIDALSEKNISQIYSDIKSNKIVATLCYSLPPTETPHPPA